MSVFFLDLEDPNAAAGASVRAAVTARHCHRAKAA
jgi:hypothetical protein